MARRGNRGSRRMNSMIARNVPPRRTSGAYDWIASSSSVDATGLAQVGAAIFDSWGGSKIMASGVTANFQAVVVQPTPMASTPTVGRLRIDEIKGRICITNGDATLSDHFLSAVCIYVSDINNTTTLWNVRQPLTVAEASRDDYLFFEGKSWSSGAYQAAGAGANLMDITFDLHLSQPVVIGGGQCLMVSVATVAETKLGAAATASLLSSWFRTRVGPVA